jgi:transposase
LPYFHESKKGKMSQRNRRRFDGQFKTKVVLEALKERQTIAQLSKVFSLHPQQITDWKKQALSGLPEVFDKDHSAARSTAPVDVESLTAPLYQKIGQLEMEVEFLKRLQKKLSAT